MGSLGVACKVRPSQPGSSSVKGADINTLDQNNKFTAGCGDHSKAFSSEDILASNTPTGSGQTGMALNGNGNDDYGTPVNTGELNMDEIGIATYQAGPIADDPTFKQTASIGFVREQDIHTCITAHLGMLADQDKMTNGFRQKNARYFSLVHFYNAALMRAVGSVEQAKNMPAKDLASVQLRPEDQKELAIYREAISKLMNSLHYGQKVIQPRAVDGAGTIFYIDLSAYGWSAYQWNKILAAYPFASVYGLSWDADRAQRVVRGDWFVSVASRPPLYHDLLQLPATVAELERVRGARSALDMSVANGASSTVFRGVVRDSPLSRSRDTVVQRNRTANNYMWREYNFKSTTDFEDVRANPMGPCYDKAVMDQQGVTSRDYPVPCGGDDGQSKTYYKDKKVFRHRGEQIIFRLPNGFQGYAIADSKGQLLCEMPEDIARDPLTEGKLVNGLSCMGCHVDGLHAFTDSLERNQRQQSQVLLRDVPPSLVMKASYLYQGQARIDEYIDLDRGPKGTTTSNLPHPPNNFAQALLQAGVAHVGGTRELPYDPILATAMAYDRDLDIFAAAAELGVTVNDYVTTAQQLGSMRNDVRIVGEGEREFLPRANWIKLWPELYFETHDDSSVPIRSYQVEPGQKTGYPSYFKTPDGQVTLGYYAADGKYTDVNNNRFNLASADPRLCTPKPGEKGVYQHLSPNYAGTGLPQATDYVPCKAHDDGKAYYLVDAQDENKGYYSLVTTANYAGEYKAQSCADEAFVPDTRYYVAPKYQQPPPQETKPVYVQPPKVVNYPTNYTAPAQAWRTTDAANQGYRGRNRYQSQQVPAGGQR
jgi:hypothetical protein